MGKQPFVGHLSAWYQGEEQRNPGWKDFEPTSRGDGMTVQSRMEKSPTRKLWDGLVAETGFSISASRLRNIHCAKRSVIWPRMSFEGPPRERIQGHVARRKTSDAAWQEISYAWLSREIRQPVVMEAMLAELVEHTPEDVSLVAFAQTGWLAAALQEQGFKAVSPHALYLPPLKVPSESACYVLRR